MKKSELRKIIRETIKEQFGGGSNTMTADCSQYTFPAENPDSSMNPPIANAQWCDWITTSYDPNFFPQLLTPWCNGEAYSSITGAFPQGFIDMMGAVNDINQCGMCYCMEQMNTGTKPAATDSFGNPISPVGPGPTSPQGIPGGAQRKPNIPKRIN